MAKYECAAIIRADIGEESIQSNLDYIKSLLEKNGAEITKIDEWGTRRLAYEINKQREGYYAIIEIEMKPNGAAVQEMLRLFRTQEQIIRVLFVAIPKLAEKNKALQDKRSKALAERAKRKAEQEEAEARRQAENQEADSASESEPVTTES